MSTRQGGDTNVQWRVRFVAGGLHDQDMDRVPSLLCVLLGLLFCVPANTAFAAGETWCVPANIRPSQMSLTRALCQHARRSATLRRLVAAVGAARLVVYIEEAGTTSRPWDGRIRFVGRAGAWRYVVIDVNPHASGPVLASLLAHELQHALEIDGGRVQDAAGFSALFARIGFRAGAAGVDAFDTVAAVEAGVATLRELTGREPLTTAHRYRLSSPERH